MTTPPTTPAQPAIPAALQEWRLAWLPEDMAWRSFSDSWRQGKEQEMAQRKRERAMRDRVFFGAVNWGVSAAHRSAEYDEGRLAARNLPLLADEDALATWLGIGLSRLRWFTHGRAASPVWHYVRYTLKKRSGGERVILAPKRDLKALQRKVLGGLLEKLPLTATAHGFVKGRSIVTNARLHVGKKYVLNLDLKDFFPSVGYARVRGLFIALGYSFSVASALAMLCTEHDREVIPRADRTVYVAVGPRGLVQGAPTSPMLANLLARRLDARLAGLARRRGFAYTRYADDLTFSGDDYTELLNIQGVAQHIITDEGFAVNTKKKRIYRQSGRQTVTGLVVNSKTSTPRELRRKMRAILHNAQKTGLAAQNHEKREDFRAYLTGLIGHIHQAEPAHAQKLLEQLRAARD